jgi:hypothetical protein
LSGVEWENEVYGEEHLGVDGETKEVENPGVLAEENVLHVEHGVGDDDETGHGGGTEEELLTVVWVEGDESFTRVEHSLSNSNEEDGIGVLLIVGGESSKQCGDSGVIGTSTDESEGEDGSIVEFGVIIVGEFAEEFGDLELRIGDRENGEGNGDASLDVNLTILKDVMEGTKYHLLTDLLGGGNEGYTEDSSHLGEGFGLVLKHSKELLNLNHTSSSNVGTSLNKYLSKLTNRVFHSSK